MKVSLALFPFLLFGTATSAYKDFVQTPLHRLSTVKESDGVMDVAAKHHSLASDAAISAPRKVKGSASRDRSLSEAYGTRGRHLRDSTSKGKGASKGPSAPIASIVPSSTPGSPTASVAGAALQPSAPVAPTAFPSDVPSTAPSNESPIVPSVAQGPTSAFDGAAVQPSSPVVLPSTPAASPGTYAPTDSPSDVPTYGPSNELPTVRFAPSAVGGTAFQPASPVAAAVSPAASSPTYRGKKGKHSPTQPSAPFSPTGLVGGAAIQPSSPVVSSSASKGSKTNNDPTYAPSFTPSINPSNFPSGGPTNDSSPVVVASHAPTGQVGGAGFQPTSPVAPSSPASPMDGSPVGATSSDRDIQCASVVGPTETTTVAFEYMIDVDPAYSVKSVISDIEGEMLSDVAGDVLVCAADSRARTRRHLAEEKASRLSIDPLDTVSGSCGESCHVVDGGMSFDTEAGVAVDVVNCTVIDSIRNSIGQMVSAVDGLTFIMFIASDVSCTSDTGRDESDTSDTADPLGSSAFEAAANSSVSGGGIAGITIAALVLVLFGALLVHRRRRAAKRKNRSSAGPLAEMKSFDDDSLSMGSTKIANSFSPTNLNKDFVDLQFPREGVVETQLRPSPVFGSSIETELRHLPSCNSATCQSCRSAGVRMERIGSKKFFSQSSLQRVYDDDLNGNRNVPSSV